jgi:hypothetical protein
MSEEKRWPIRIPHDFQTTDGEWNMVLRPEHTPPEALVPGTRVFLYDSGDIEGVGIVQRGKHYPWVAEMIVETIRAPGYEGYTWGRGLDPSAPEDPVAVRLRTEHPELFPELSPKPTDTE